MIPSDNATVKCLRKLWYRFTPCSFFINKIHFFFPEDFTAHNADVKCLGLGHKSGRVMVTGGDDRKVNLWSVGKPQCIMVSTLSCFKVIA